MQKEPRRAESLRLLRGSKPMTRTGSANRGDERGWGQRQQLDRRLNVNVQKTWPAGWDLSPAGGDSPRQNSGLSVSDKRGGAHVRPKNSVSEPGRPRLPGSDRPIDGKKPAQGVLSRGDGCSGSHRSVLGHRLPEGSTELCIGSSTREESSARVGGSKWPCGEGMPGRTTPGLCYLQPQPGLNIQIHLQSPRKGRAEGPCEHIWSELNIQVCL